MQRTAKRAGAAYALYFLTAVASGLLVKGIVVPQSAQATAVNILAHESLLRFGSATSLLSTVLYLAIIALLYDLLLRVSGPVSIFAALAGLVGARSGRPEASSNSPL